MTNPYKYQTGSPVECAIAGNLMTIIPGVVNEIFSRDPTNPIWAIRLNWSPPGYEWTLANVEERYIRPQGSSDPFPFEIPPDEGP